MISGEATRPVAARSVGFPVCAESLRGTYPRLEARLCDVALARAAKRAGWGRPAMPRVKSGCALGAVLTPGAGFAFVGGHLAQGTIPHVLRHVQHRRTSFALCPEPGLLPSGPAVDGAAAAYWPRYRVIRRDMTFRQSPLLFLPIWLACFAVSDARAADTVAYTVSIAGTGNSALDKALSGSSELESLRSAGAIPPFALVGRAQLD